MPYLPKMIVGAAGFAALAVTAWRSHAAPRVAYVFFALTALIALVLTPHQPTALAAGIALPWLAHTATRRTSA
ncbi:hypothetical protein [Frankia gtarii]|uniref:hypothetical protein n=1 Tax=Frankia gtarii TaxID=2950102 RepID=UPI0021BED56E|nr:hypothetical protein [Frankia gtarii]